MAKRYSLLVLIWLTPLLHAAAQEKSRIYIVDRDEWELSGGFNGDVGSIHAGVQRDYTEILKTFAQACPQVIFTSDRAKAGYAVVLDRSNAELHKYRNNFVIFNRDGDVIYSGATFSLKNAAKDSCKAVLGVPKKSP